MFYKIIAVIFSLLFIISAGLQFNDPDPLLWIIIYGIATMFSGLFVMGKLPSKVLLFIVGLAFTGFIVSFPETLEGFEVGKGDPKNIEEGREAFGLLIIAISFTIYSIGNKKSKNKIFYIFASK